MQLYLILYIKICYDSENDVRFVIHLLCLKNIFLTCSYVTQTRLRLCRKKRIQIHISRKRKATTYRKL